uniref:Tubulin beta chain n=1 Tax=Tetrahymena thermophila TaxID=5911 RepID=I6U4Q6_TETTH|nr:beta-like tubulin 4 [Tetrahymena thermophila]
MREILNIQIGQAGNQIGTAYWEEISKEHGIQPTGVHKGDSDLQLEKIDVYYNQTKADKYVPRAILIDLDPALLNSINTSQIGQLFKPENLIIGQDPAENNWAIGHYILGPQYIDQVMETVRKEAEICDCLQGFQMIHSIGGGTGSGMGTLLLQKLKEEYPDRITETFSIFPSTKISDKIIEPYNALLSINQLIEYADQTMVIDNEALYDICFRVAKLYNPNLKDLNYYISSAISSITCTLRFPGLFNSDLRKIALNLIPFPRLHFLMSAIAPSYSRGSTQCYPPKFPEIKNLVYNPRTMLCSTDWRYGRFLAASAIFRGRIPYKDFFEQVVNSSNEYNSYFVQQIPNNLKYSKCDIPLNSVRLSGVLIGNSTAIKDVFNRISNQFTALFQNKTFLSQYTNKGMEEIEFKEAHSNVMDLISEYQQCENLFDEEAEFDEFDDEEMPIEENKEIGEEKDKN